MLATEKNCLTLVPNSGDSFDFKTSIMTGKTMKSKKAKPQADIDWENRKLCSDESCIGVIGPDGRCKECGKAFKG